jgi:hypothetical protein
MEGAGRRAHVECELVGVALVVDGALGFEEAVASAWMKLIVQVIRLDSVGVMSDGYLVGVLMLKETKNPQLSLEFGKGRDGA